ncbi:unnamed protein product [Tetraodon nigroviridis]|uniref:(spotted green pufferfish) hypothetical protein n=1 Tax=Tetraodon nigroviridis TaxID=99883 RepID=Q4SFF9_TETNG|nr:unnamed protein product [Tetraodon nigroviridis]
MAMERDKPDVFRDRFWECYHPTPSNFSGLLPSDKKATVPPLVFQNGRNADTANECELRAVRADAVPGNPRSEYAFPPEASGLMTTAGIAILGHDGKEALETCFTHLQKAVGTSGAPIPQQSIPQARNPDQLRGIQFFQTVSSTLRSKINQKEGLGIWELASRAALFLQSALRGLVVICVCSMALGRFDPATLRVNTAPPLPLPPILMPPSPNCCYQIWKKESLGACKSVSQPTEEAISERFLKHIVLQLDIQGVGLVEKAVRCPSSLTPGRSQTSVNGRSNGSPLPPSLFVPLN